VSAMQKYRIVVILNTPGAGREIKSPRFDTEEQAQADMAKIRAVQASGELLDLPWLSVRGGSVIAAHLERVMSPPLPRR
jgi:hypothetical protein